MLALKVAAKAIKQPFTNFIFIVLPPEPERVTSSCPETPGYGRYATLSELGCDRNGRARPKPAAQSPKHPGARCRLFDTSEKHDQPARCSLRAPDHPLQESRDRCPCSGRSSFQSCRLPEPAGIFLRRKCRHDPGCRAAFSDALVAPLPGTACHALRFAIKLKTFSLHAAVYITT